MRALLQSHESSDVSSLRLGNGQAAEATAAPWATQLQRGSQEGVSRPLLGAARRAGIERWLQATNPMDPGNLPLRNSPNFGSGFLALLAVTVVAIAGVMIVRLCFIRRLLMRRRQAGAGAGPGEQEGEQQQAPEQRKGLDPELLAFLPVQPYIPEPSDQELPQSTEPSSAAAVQASAEHVAEHVAGAPHMQAMRECPVCLSEYEPGEPIKFLPGCGHTFHDPCVVAWLGSKTTCPLCREEVGPALQELANAERAKRVGEPGVGVAAAAVREPLALQEK